MQSHDSEQPDDVRTSAHVQSSSSAEPPGNPFATRHVRPGAIPYFFSAGESLETLVDQLAASAWRGEIVGPHGSGKSTLLAGLIAAMQQRGRNVIVYRLREGDRQLPNEPQDVRTLTANDIVVVDGYEQLPWWRKWQLRSLCKGKGLGLLVTTHAPAGLPRLWQTSVDQGSVERVVEHLLAIEPTAASLIARDDVVRALADHPSNAREVLFALYDVVERRRSGAVQ
jgi:energy-coupling factor transporter ATP-binding protein EcfA2